MVLCIKNATMSFLLFYDSLSTVCQRAEPAIEYAQDFRGSLGGFTLQLQVIIQSRAHVQYLRYTIACLMRTSVFLLHVSVPTVPCQLALCSVQQGNLGGMAGPKDL